MNRIRGWPQNVQLETKRRLKHFARRTAQLKAQDGPSSAVQRALRALRSLRAANLRAMASDRLRAISATDVGEIERSVVPDRKTGIKGPRFGATRTFADVTAAAFTNRRDRDRCRDSYPSQESTRRRVNPPRDWAGYGRISISCGAAA